MAFDWTAARVERLHHLLTQEQAPYSLIAEVLGHEAGERLSRNAISGKIDRLRKDCPGNWPVPVHSPGPPKPRVRRPRPAKRTDCWQSNGNGHANPPTPLKPTPRADRAIAPAQRRMISELSAYDRRCRWPIGDPSKPNFYFCGATSKVDRPYCARHCKEAYMQPGLRRNGG